PRLLLHRGLQRVQLVLRRAAGGELRVAGFRIPQARLRGGAVDLGPRAWAGARAEPAAVLGDLPGRRHDFPDTAYQPRHAGPLGVPGIRLLDPGIEAPAGRRRGCRVQRGDPVMKAIDIHAHYFPEGYLELLA